MSRGGDCAHCGQSFEDRSPAQRKRYCSDRCRRDAFQAKPESRVPCVSCGGPTGRTPGQTSVRAEGERQCGKCRRKAAQAPRLERGRRIEQWWAEGLTLAQMADRLGWSRGSICSEHHWLRTHGFDLPYRYPEARRVAACVGRCISPPEPVDYQAKEIA